MMDLRDGSPEVLHLPRPGDELGVICHEWLVDGIIICPEQFNSEGDYLFPIVFLGLANGDVGRHLPKSVQIKYNKVAF